MLVLLFAFRIDPFFTLLAGIRDGAHRREGKQCRFLDHERRST